MSPTSDGPAWPRTVLGIGGGLAIIVVVGALLGGARTGGLDGAQAAPHFADEAATAGVDHRYDGDEYFVGGGVAVFDCDADGKAELYLAGGSRPAGLFHNDSPIGGALAFHRLASEATDLDAVTGAYPLDVDGDGLIDLAVLRHGGNVLLRGTGDCRFEPANADWSFGGGDAWSTAFSATWEAGVAWPTLAIGNYLDEASTDPERRCAENWLVRPNTDAAGFREPEALSPGWCSLSMLFTDWDRSGRRDLRVSNDRHYYGVQSDGEEQLWRLEPGATPRLYTEADGWQSVRIWGMGIASADLTDDGYPDYYLTSQADNKLQVLADGPAQPRYEDIALERGATATRPYAGDTDLPSTAWHAEFQDVNNDGYLDLFVAKGNVESMPDYAARDPSNLLIGQADGTFVEGAEAAGIVNYAKARGAALADLNLDGLVDLVVVYRREPVGIWRNVGAGTAEAPAPTGHWLALRLVQADPNHDAIGAWIEVRTGDRVQRREVTIGGGHVGGQLGWIHVGVGDADEAEVRVQWPDGETGPWIAAGVDRFAIVNRETGAAEAWSPGDALP